jgi:hypothetical protein
MACRANSFGDQRVSLMMHRVALTMRCSKASSREKSNVEELARRHHARARLYAQDAFGAAGFVF